MGGREVILWDGSTGCQTMIMDKKAAILSLSAPKGDPPYCLGLWGAPRSSRPTQLVPRMITALKRFTNQDMKTDLWQDGFHDHIIRNEANYLRIWAYIDQNPAKWREDRYYEEGIL